MTTTCFVKIETAPRKSYYLLSELKDGGKEGFKLTITDGERVWAGQVTEDDLDRLCTKMKMDFETFVKQTAKAFTRQETGDLSFEYQVKPQGDNSVSFIWKKYVPADDIRFQMGSASLDLKPDSRVLICEMFSHCIEKIGQRQTQIHTLETDNERLSQERTMALKRLDKCVTAKEEMEKDLYSKFVAVLNSKKEKIRSLKCHGTGDQTHPEGANMEVETTGVDEDSADDVSTNSQNKVRRRESEEENTDDEETTSRKRRQKPTIVKTSDHDSSLVLEDDTDEPTTHPVTRPARRTQGRKKQTPSKPILPKVSSKSSDGGRKNSLRKSGSNSSNRSSNDIEPEDLFEDL
ncbi:DNA repair protein XRCC4-like isoform X2 [Gigantopelta aegis]|uniref:DNA repair protein XRCC4-like isoform X2 n=1 Tax=Gigantopelta aegis TaxID=1735272 RepID=UPI001B88C4BE|nr:DNA repair protein XRCC4-like isoform X2 [Gigantopelta aegis]